MLLTERRERFREYLLRDGCIRPASVFDPISARLAESAGYEIGMLAGSIASAVVLGAPDWTLITLTEFAEQAHRITRGSAISLMVDADHGYGNALNVMRTVQEMEAAGVSALTIEDTILPTTFAAQDDLQLISTEEMIGKLRAATRARSDSSLVIIGRSASPKIDGPGNVIDRIIAYSKTGIDALFLTGISTLDELNKVHDSVDLPIILGSGSPEFDDLEQLASRGVKIAQKGHLPIRAAIKALYETYKAQRTGLGIEELKEHLASADLMGKGLTQERYDQWRDTFLH